MFPAPFLSVAFDRGRNGIRSLKAEKLGDGTPDWPDTLSNFAAVIFGGRSWLFCSVLRAVHVRARALGQLLAH